MAVVICWISLLSSLVWDNHCYYMHCSCATNESPLLAPTIVAITTTTLYLVTCSLHRHHHPSIDFLALQWSFYEGYFSVSLYFNYIAIVQISLNGSLFLQYLQSAVSEVSSKAFSYEFSRGLVLSRYPEVSNQTNSTSCPKIPWIQPSV